MRKRRAAAGAAVIAGVLATATVALAATTVTVTGTASTKAATKAKPTAFKAVWNVAADAGAGVRPATPISWSWKWTGVTVNTKGFPTCTAEQIDAAQSDAGCPKGALIAKTTETITAELGPTIDPTSNTACAGKNINIYNGGDNKLVWVIVGPGDQCAGLAYFPPFTSTLTTSGGTTTDTLDWPENITHALPGIDGALVNMKMSFLSPSRKAGKKKVFFMQNNGCKGKRKLSFTTVDSEGTKNNTVSLGACK